MLEAYRKNKAQQQHKAQVTVSSSVLQALWCVKNLKFSSLILGCWFNKKTYS